MEESERNDDAAFVNEMMAKLPATAVPPSLEARILADFDRVAEANRPGAVTRWARRWRDSVWPGAPVWQPASLLALSLAIGLMAGALVPTSTLATAVNSGSSEQALTATDTASTLDLYKDL
jgi:hypothetical protein